MSGRAARRALSERVDIERVVDQQPSPIVGVSLREDLVAVRRFVREERDLGIRVIACALRAHDLHAAHDLEAIEHALEAAR